MRLPQWVQTIFVLTFPAKELMVNPGNVSIATCADGANVVAAK